MKRKTIITVLNIILVCAMLIHTGLALFLHDDSKTSAPIEVELFRAVPYLILLLIVNIVNLVLTVREKKRGVKPKETKLKGEQ